MDEKTNQLQLIVNIMTGSKRPFHYLSIDTAGKTIFEYNSHEKIKEKSKSVKTKAYYHHSPSTQMVEYFSSTRLKSISKADIPENTDNRFIKAYKLAENASNKEKIRYYILKFDTGYLILEHYREKNKILVKHLDHK